MLKQVRMAPAAVVTDYFVDGATGDLQDAALDLEETLTPDGLAHQLSFVSSGNIANADFIVVGRDADGNQITETVTGITTSPVETTRYFKEVLSITGADNADSDISSETLDVGFVDECVSPTLLFNWRQCAAPAHTLWIESGTLEADVQLTIADPGRYAEQEDIPWTLAIVAGLDDVQNNEYWEIPAGVVAGRVKFNSYSSAPSGTLYVSQPEV